MMKLETLDLTRIPRTIMVVKARQQFYSARFMHDFKGVKVLRIKVS